MTKPKATHENWGGPRKAGQGKSIGRPKGGGPTMERYNLRLPPEWADKIKAYGGGKLPAGVRKIIRESGVVD